MTHFDDSLRNWLHQRNQQKSEALRLVNSRTSILITGPIGSGKASFIQDLVLTLNTYSDVGLQWLNLHAADAHIDVELVLKDIETHRLNKELVVVLDGAEVFTNDELHGVIRQFTNFKRVLSVIATTINTSFDLSGLREIRLNYPEGRLYGLREQVVRPETRIIQVVAPSIVTFNDVLIERLKQCPTDLFSITPRQFEEVVADLLSGMGLEVELTPATRDGGKDILAYMETPVGKLLTLVEAKQHNKRRPIGVSLVRGLFGTLMDHQATSAMLVTTSRFAKPAQQFQERHQYQLELKDYGDVVGWLMKHSRAVRRP